MLTLSDAITYIDLIGTAVFAISGGLLAVRKNFDLFGAAVLALSAGLAGGVFRDLVIGQTPPSTFADYRYLLVALLGGAGAFYLTPLLTKASRPILVLDTIGLGLFAVSGCKLALGAELNALAAILLGVLSAVGGGILRDILAQEIPKVFREELYATSALIGAVIIAIGDRMGINFTMTGTIAFGVIILMRGLSFRYGWRLPRSPWAK